MAPSGEVRRERASGSMSELGLRISSAIVLVALALAATWYGGWFFSALWLAAGIAIIREALVMATVRRRGVLLFVAAAGLVAVSVATRLGMPASSVATAGAATLAAIALAGATTRDRLWALAGWGYAASVVLVPVIVRDRPELGSRAILWMFAVVWCTDIAAFFVGRRLGGPKLWRRVSPGKTWSGFCGGLVVATLAGLAVATIGQPQPGALPFGIASIAAASALASIVSQLGDLGESALKRLFAVKDSGDLIPGHGGVMDRLDGFVAVAFLVGLALLGAHLAGPQG